MHDRICIVHASILILSAKPKDSHWCKNPFELPLFKSPEKVGKPQGVKEISELAEQQIFVSPEVILALYCAEAQAPG
jgi:hypothetical protein